MSIALASCQPECSASGHAAQVNWSYLSLLAHCTQCTASPPVVADCSQWCNCRKLKPSCKLEMCMGIYYRNSKRAVTLFFSVKRTSIWAYNIINLMSHHYETQKKNISRSKHLYIKNRRADSDAQTGKNNEQLCHLPYGIILLSRSICIDDNCHLSMASSSV